MEAATIVEDHSQVVDSASITGSCRAPSLKGSQDIVWSSDVNGAARFLCRMGLFVMLEAAP